MHGQAWNNNLESMVNCAYDTQSIFRLDRINWYSVLMSFRPRHEPSGWAKISAEKNNFSLALLIGFHWTIARDNIFERKKFIEAHTLQLFFIEPYVVFSGEYIFFSVRVSVWLVVYIKKKCRMERNRNIEQRNVNNRIRTIAWQRFLFLAEIIIIEVSVTLNKVIVIAPLILTEYLFMMMKWIHRNKSIKSIASIEINSATWSATFKNPQNR